VLSFAMQKLRIYCVHAVKMPFRAMCLRSKIFNRVRCSGTSRIIEALLGDETALT
jgi:hypothetical protein